MTHDNVDLTKLEIPAGYKELIKKLVSKCNGTSFQQNIVDYANFKQTIGLRRDLTPISNSIASMDEFISRQVVSLTQANFLGSVGKTAPMEVKPLLYHYGENSLFSFLVYSLISFNPTYSRSHGMTISTWSNDFDEIELQFSNSGFFSRLVDCYSICKAYTSFSPIIWNTSTNEYEANTHQFSLKNNLKIKLKDLIEHRKNLGKNLESYYYDLIDFVLLFAGSSLSRYRSSLWTQISRGEKGTQVIWFNECFSRYDNLHSRVLNTILDICENGSPQGCSLHKLDS